MRSLLVVLLLALVVVPALLLGLWRFLPLSFFERHVWLWTLAWGLSFLLYRIGVPSVRTLRPGAGIYDLAPPAIRARFPSHILS